MRIAVRMPGQGRAGRCRALPLRRPEAAPVAAVPAPAAEGPAQRSSGHVEAGGGSSMVGT